MQWQLPLSWLCDLTEPTPLVAVLAEQVHTMALGWCVVAIASVGIPFNARLLMRVRHVLSTVMRWLPRLYVVFAAVLIAIAVGKRGVCTDDTDCQ
ncbi:MAG: hypothetical protein ABL868_00560 [Sulfuriferula sp.]